MAEGVSSQVETARYGAMPGFSQLEPEPLWTQSTGDSKICVAVIDGPVDLSHPCFQGANLSVVETLVPNVVDDGLASLHGTHIASIIFGRHSGPVRGVAPDCRGLIIPVYKSGTRDALHPCSQLDLARAITQAVGNGANVINISGGQLDPSGQAHPLLAHAVRICADSGVLIVAAAGNDGCACLHIPASEPSVLVVGAMDSNGAPMDFSNWGNKYAGRGILAPGENILGAVPGGGTALQTGTSFAAPIVSGIVALLLSIQIKRGQNPDARAACKAILDSAIGCSSQPVPDCSRLLAGRLNAVGAVAHLNEGGKVEMSEQIKETADPSNGAEEIDAHRSPGVEPIGLQCRSSVSAAAAAVQPALSAPGIIPAELPSGGPGRTQVPPAPLAYAPGGITSSGGCGCGGGGAGGGCSCASKARPALVYVLGEIGYDFSIESRRDSYLQHSGKNLFDPHQLLEYLGSNPADAAGIIWTLNIDATPIYALQPAGGFAAFAYDRIREFLAAQLNEGAERVSVPGYTSGNVTLLSGQTVPVIFPEVRGMYSWSTQALINAVHGRPGGEQSGESHNEKEEDVRNFLERVYYEIRNLGVAPQERAINYAATNAFQIENIYKDAITQNVKLDTIDVERSPICRPESDCWDVKLTFFNPHKRMEEARKVYRFTVDVSDVVPVTVGKVRSWHIF